jgi:hypothetical protein
LSPPLAPWHNIDFRHGTQSKIYQQPQQPKSTLISLQQDQHRT